MKITESHTYEKVVLTIEVIGFSILLAVLWLDEYLDVPFLCGRRNFGSKRSLCCWSRPR
jgi:hypothetical protein